MKKLAAFAAAFLFALTVALVPLAVSDLGRTGAQPSVDAQQASALPAGIKTTPVYEYFVWPGIQEEVADAYLYLRRENGEGDVHEDDNGGGWNNSRIYKPIEGEQRYIVEATTAEQGETGSFELSGTAFRSAAARRSHRPIAPGEASSATTA